MKRTLILLFTLIVIFNVSAQITSYEDFIKASEDILVYKNKEKQKIDYK